MLNFYLIFYRNLFFVKNSHIASLCVDCLALPVSLCCAFTFTTVTVQFTPPVITVSNRLGCETRLTVGQQRCEEAT